ncbi:MAG: hypothetical protein ACPG43_08625 [Alcanivoracaceae bacterium]
MSSGVSRLGITGVAGRIPVAPPAEKRVFGCAFLFSEPCVEKSQS